MKENNNCNLFYYFNELLCANQNLDKIRDLFYPIIMILRREKEGCRNYELKGRDVVITTADKKEILRIPADNFLIESEKLLMEINKNKGAFAIPEIEKFLSSIHCHSLKAKSTDKTDINIILHDCRTKLHCEMGFSIKSQLGGDSTLLNSSKTTNFNFKILDTDLSTLDIDAINAIDSKRNKVIERVNAIKQRGGRLVFDRIDNPTFANNLAMLDGDLPLIISNLLLEQLNTGISGLRELTERLAQTNPLNYHTSDPLTFYTYKIKHLLTSVALGMMPATAWNGRFDANGGYLVVKKDGDILCYHFYDRNRFEDYLFFNAYLERASTTRHEYASVIKEKDGSLSFKLNLQIRLK